MINSKAGIDVVQTDFDRGRLTKMDLVLGLSRVSSSRFTPASTTVIGDCSRLNPRVTQRMPAMGD